MNTDGHENRSEQAPGSRRKFLHQVGMGAAATAAIAGRTLQKGQLVPSVLHGFLLLWRSGILLLAPVPSWRLRDLQQHHPMIR